MPQVLIINGQPKEVDRKFVRDAIPAVYTMERGHRILVTEGKPSAPEIYQKGTYFFFSDLSPVTKAEDIGHLPRCRKCQGIEEAPRVHAKDVPPCAWWQAMQQVLGGDKVVKSRKARHSPDRITKGTVRPAPGAGFLAGRRQSTRRMSDLMPEGAEAE